MENKITLDLGENSYDILVGSKKIDFLPNFLGKNKYSKIFIITDENVASLHLSRLEAVLSQFKLEKIVIKSGENSKSFAVLEQVCEEILAKNIDRKSLILAFGGGVVGDLAGFAASILLRGIDFVQIPTTLLAAVDSSVGGKTAINARAGKNLIGSFYQPKLVICDTDFLATLPKREIRAGYAEILKYGLIFDREFFDFLDQNYENIFAINQNYIEKIILKSCEVKAKIVSLDEKEQGLRALLNFGHTFGHCFEGELNYDNRLNHGEAVGIGMLMAAKMSKNLGFLPENDYKIILQHITKTSLNIDLKAIENNWSKQNLASHLYKDKKTENGKLTFILLEAIGNGFVKKDIEIGEFMKVIDDFV